MYFQKESRMLSNKLLVSHSIPDWHDRLHEAYKRLSGSTPISIDECNVPIEIRLRLIEDSTLWELTWTNFMPRKNSTGAEGRLVGSEADLRSFVREFMLPLYTAALANVFAIANGDGKSQYFWWNSER